MAAILADMTTLAQTSQCGGRAFSATAGRRALARSANAIGQARRQSVGRANRQGGGWVSLSVVVRVVRQFCTRPIHWL
ncbi:hypothetical protein chiPu_0020099 [Chiloscyllium punctatum]|uniref:Uncharacterized protein n=1 Tax=Chiloscyllium punctatum TaxID=137246 RepID=A0A401RU03_CHIPU|nr:hypothetical protein [Chiloscyllium punctatum]